MVLNKIENLLEKYENAETTLQEEQQLKDYFSQETVEPHLEVYKPMFAYFAVNQQEQFTKDVPLKTKYTFSYKWISVAAVVVLMLGFYFNRPVQDFGTFDESQQELAFNEVKNSLEMISNTFNKGVDKVTYLNEFNKGVSSVNYLNEVENTTNIIFKPNN